MSAAGRKGRGAPEKRVGETQQAGVGADPSIAGHRWWSCHLCLGTTVPPALWMGKLRHRAMKGRVHIAEERQCWDSNPDHLAGARVPWLAPREGVRTALLSE